MTSTNRVHAFIRRLLLTVLVSAVMVLPSAAAALDPLPAGFTNRLAQGWLPDVCVRPDNPEFLPSSLPDWARPRDGKRVRVLFICNSAAQYEPLMVAHAFDLECDIIPLWGLYSWRENDLDPDTMNLLRYYLGARRYDVIAMTSAWLSALPDDCEKKIAELVKEQGVGFVYALPGIMLRLPEWQGKPSPILDPLIPIVLDPSGYKAKSRQALPAAPHPLSRGVDFSRIQWYCDTDGAIVPEATVVLRSELPNRMLAAAVTRGKGRVVAYNRCYNENIASYPFLPVVDCPTDETQTGKRCRWLGEKESAVQFYNWLGRVLLWAAQADPPVRIESVSVSAAGDIATIRATNSAQASVSFRLRGTVSSPFDTTSQPFETRWRLPAGAAETIAVRLPDTGFQGRHALNLSLATADGKIMDWSSSVFEKAGTFSVSLAPNFALHTPAEDISVPLQIGGLPAGKQFTIRAELFDLDGRLLVDQQRKASAAGGQTLATETIRLAPTTISSALANLRITVEADGEKAEARDQLFVRQEPRWEQFHIMAYGGCDHNLISSDALIDALKRSGHDTIMYAFANPFRARVNTETGMRCLAGHTSSACNFEAQRIRELLSWLRKFSPVVYEQQDEPELQYTLCAEARYNDPSSMKRFYGWLKEKYGTMEGLNASWGTHYAAWEEARRVLWYEAADTNNWAPWFDSRRDLDRSFVDIYDRSAKAIHEIEPNRFCPINPRSVETFGGTDLREFTRRLRASSLYNRFCANPPMGYLELGAQWVEFAQSVGGYTWAAQPNPDALAHEAWDSMRHGVKHLTWFAPICDESPPLGRFSYLAGDNTLNEKGKAIGRINRQLLAGPGDVAVNTAPLNEGVFIYYPRTLFYTHTLAHMKKQRDNDPTLDPAKMTGLGPWMEQLPNSFVIPMRAMGYQFQFGDEQDLTAELLKKTRVVFLSRIVCLGPRELELLREFVKTGGCVVAEGGTARRDGDGRLYAQTPDAFRELFGVQRPAPNPSPIVGRDGVVSCGAKKLDWVAPAVGAAYQNGTAFFLDFVVPNNADGYLLVQHCLDLAGIKPTYYLRDNTESNTLTSTLLVRRRGDLTWLYVLGEGEGKRFFNIELPQPQYVYELTADRNLGLLSSIRDEVRYGEARVFALSPAPAVTLKAEPSKSACRPGEVIRIHCALTLQSGEVGERLFRVECAGPQGSLLPVLPRLIRAAKGRADLDFFVPLNAAPGELKLTVIDLASGARCQSIITIESKSAKPRTFRQWLFD